MPADGAAEQASQAAGQRRAGAWHPTLTYLVLLVVAELAAVTVLSYAIGWQWI